MLDFKKGKMKQLLNSDRNSTTMLATKVFVKIIDDIRESNLNFQLQMSPFAAHISLKRSFIKDMSGIPQLPTSLETKSPKDPDSQSIIADLVSLNIGSTTLQKSLPPRVKG